MSGPLIGRTSTSSIYSSRPWVDDYVGVQLGTFDRADTAVRCHAGGCTKLNNGSCRRAGWLAGWGGEEEEELLPLLPLAWVRSSAELRLTHSSLPIARKHLAGDVCTCTRRDAERSLGWWHPWLPAWVPPPQTTTSTHPQDSNQQTMY